MHERDVQEKLITRGKLVAGRQCWVVGLHARKRFQHDALGFVGAREAEMGGCGVGVVAVDVARELVEEEEQGDGAFGGGGPVVELIGVAGQGNER